ncbi:tripartite tricarboxylate transporter substrate-binding protein [Cupriavidus consociatus]|uniref:tripartite tricarboxylate transporter substrate-binding protein n=1 Tax=Cupriavidus consociatus TaxID=2821357 RepID=UPI001AE9DC9A|nr:MULTISPECIES: tripartite tricarboxylate transporter substrate-binding protein [unclassified Cupriavidus]MBP0620706.1 hydroxyacid dehydrogenase [Cupriavidus sp. LEh25]MDK2657366.1 tripartite tricarboxylate transporter substrate-binding protein [Cupriavidus sp. LEh21]
MPYTVLVTAPRLAGAGVRLLEAANASVHYLPDADSPQALHGLLRTLPVDAGISRTVALTGAAIDACPTLKVISKHGVGVSNIDVAAATARGIPVYVTPGANAQSVAELTLALMFAAARRVPWMDRELRAGRWSRAQDGVELQGRTIGLVGFGQVAQRVARVCLALGMRVAAFDPALAGAAARPADVDCCDSLDALLAASDVAVVLVVRHDSPFHTLADFLRQARARSGETGIAQAGNGTVGHLAGEMLARRAGVRVMQVPYKGAGPAMNDLLGGQVPAYFGNTVSVMPQLAAGSIRALAVTSAQRLSALPSVPTVAEQGFAGFEATTWLGLVAPAGLPADITAKLSAATLQVLARPDVQQRLKQEGSVATPTSPAAFAAHIRAEHAKWGALIREAQIKLS